ncbi:inhibitor of Bruton tyrosine kinase [Euwallacea similis]|uniref:inhibitor of Bruton tyrosine kinase n=1 Tax=Euwallacea similis TaxID=1736056 RepID=UPI00344F15A8
MNKQPQTAPDCTSRCQSSQHGDSITAAITKRSVTDSDLSSYLTYTCCCCESVKDSVGRTALHVAAACGRSNLVSWLVNNRHANINMKDKESGYTALHRSIFYGKIETAVELIKLGANGTLQDANSLTYLEHAMMDRFCPPDLKFSSGELFTWGANSNNSLGSQLPRTVPESMDIFHKEYSNENVRQVLIGQFHSVILTESGSVYSCGHGQGGRLGLGVQHSEVIPKPIKFPVAMNVPHFSEKIQIISCSIARDHSIFLASSGELYSCGLNKHRVLGIAPPPAELLVPKILKHLADNSSHVGTGNYHSLVWNKSGIYTWGLNAGQLGHQLVNPSDKYILTSKKVTCISSKENTIKLVCASTGATVVYTEKGDVYILHEYQCRKIASRQLNLVEIAVIGGNLNHSLDPELSNKNRELKVAALTNTGSLFLWQESDAILRRCIFSINRSLNIIQVGLNINNVLFVTKDGEAYKGEARPRKRKAADKEKSDKTFKSDFHKFIDKDECISVKLERIPRVHRAVWIQSDPKGHNYGIVQDRPYKYFTPYDITASTMSENMSDLLTTADGCDGITDIEINISGRLFPAHKYVLASRSQYFLNLFNKNHNSIMEFKGYQPIIFEEFLKYIYTGNSELLELGDLKNEALLHLCLKPLQENDKENDAIVECEDGSNRSAFEYYSRMKDQSTNNVKKLENPVRMLHEMAKRFEVVELQKILSNLDMVKCSVRVKKGGKEVKKSPIIFNKSACPELYDVEIICKDNKVLKAHKCILSARLDYFGNMFSIRWGGDVTSKMTMPYSKSVVDALLEFIYTDSLDRLDEKDMDQLFKIIILADQFFVDRLKEQCENILSNLLTIKNAVQLLALADAYNADNLKANCFEFMQQNMISFLELRLLDDLNAPLLKELSDFYQIRRSLDCRVITPYSTAISDEEITMISSMYPMDITEKKDKNNGKQKMPNSSKKRSRTHKSSTSEKILSESFEKEVAQFANNNASISKFSSKRAEGSLLENSIPARVKSIVVVNNLGLCEGEFEEDFTPLQRTSDYGSPNASFGDFPLLNSPPKQLGFYSKPQHKLETKAKVVKLSQKQRKRLSSESSNIVLASSPNLAESPKNPWKILQDPVSPVNSPPTDNFETIISNERKQKENLVKITSKQLVYTQIEDKAIDELKKFYNVDNIEDEIITIERVSMGAVALPVWVPKTK